MKILDYELEEKDGKLFYCGSLYLEGTNITNYPVVYNCGVKKKSNLFRLKR